MTKKEQEERDVAIQTVLDESKEFRVPSGDDNSDWHYAKCASHDDPLFKDADVKHLHACVFGENDGPSWIWIVELKDGEVGVFSAWCDYTGWGCQDEATWTPGFKTALEAAESVDDPRKEWLIKQVKGEQPYGLTG